MQANFRFKQSELGVFETKNANLAIKGFENGCRIIGLSRGNFSLIDLMHSILKKTGPADVVICTWSAGIKDVHNVKWMIDTHLIKSVIVITDHSYVTRQKQYAASIEQLFGIENIRTSEIHAKFLLISNDNYKVTIRTSMNLNANKTCENFEIDENEDIYNFYNQFVNFVNQQQQPGFIPKSSLVNKTLDNFFKSHSNKLSGWSEI